jgi:hypothetical protein
MSRQYSSQIYDRRSTLSGIKETRASYQLRTQENQGGENGGE